MKWNFQVNKLIRSCLEEEMASTPVFLPGESQRRRSLVGCRLWSRRVGHDWRDLAIAAVWVTPILEASLMTQMVKNRPAIQDTRVRSLGGEDSLEKGIAIHSSFLAWRIPRTEVPGGLQSMGSQRVRHDWMTITFAFEPYTLRENKQLKCKL